MKKKDRELRKSLVRAEKAKEKYGYILNKMPTTLLEKNIKMRGDKHILEYISYEEAIHDEYFDSIDYICFQHYVLGMNMKYPSKLESLLWSYINNRWYSLHTNDKIINEMKLCDETKDTYELPVLPNTITRLYIYSIILKPIKALPNMLVRLEIDNSKLKYLPELPETLKYLDCKCNELVELPKLPSKLHHLICDWNNLTYLPEIPKSLLCLSCGPDIKKMPDSIVNFRGNNITTNYELVSYFKWKKELFDFIENQCKFDLAILLKYQKAVEVIENQYLEAKYNPEYQLCKNRLKNEYDEMYQEE